MLNFIKLLDKVVDHLGHAGNCDHTAWRRNECTCDFDKVRNELNEAVTAIGCLFGDEDVERIKQKLADIGRDLK